jgi:hypothetical protein
MKKAVLSSLHVLENCHSYFAGNCEMKQNTDKHKMRRGMRAVELWIPKVNVTNGHSQVD